MAARRTARNLPSTAEGLRAWLKGSDEGRTIAGELTSQFLEEKCRACTEINPNPKVLVVLRRLGLYPGVEVFAEEGVTVRCLELPIIPDEYDSITDRLIAAKLPRRWRGLLELPAKRITAVPWAGVSVDEAVAGLETLALIRELRSLTETKEKTR